MTTRTSEQEIARLEARIAHIRSRDRTAENGRKIILGGMLINAARTDLQIRTWLLQEAEKSVTREIDRARLAPLLARLRDLPSTPPASPPVPKKKKADKAEADKGDAKE